MSVPGWPEQLERYIAAPAEAFKHPVDKYVTVALNRNSGLFGPGKSFADRLRRDGADHVLALAAAELDRCGWAVYRVRRCYSRPATAWRSVETVYRGSRAAASQFLTELGRHLGICPHDDGEHARVWLTEPSITFPRTANIGYRSAGNSRAAAAASSRACVVSPKHRPEGPHRRRHNDFEEPTVSGVLAIVNGDFSRH